MNQWTVDGINRLAEQSFWYRVGDSAQQRLNALVLSSWNAPLDNMLIVNYADPLNRFTVQLNFTLVGADAGAGVSDVGETIKIKSLLGQPLDFHLYEYVDVNLLGPTQRVDSSLVLTGTPVNTAKLSNGGELFETVSTPAASQFEAGYAGELLSKLTSGSVYNLNDTASATAGDLAWAFQWDATINPGKSLLVSIDKRLDVAPEPSTLVLLGVGGVAMLGYVGRRRWPW